MAKGVIYLMTTSVVGLVKIGKTNTDQFENRMRFLEGNGYYNVSGRKRKFAIEVEDFDEKEVLLHDIFSKSRVGDSELFAVDPNLAEQLMSSFEGKQIYPKPEVESKAKVFENATNRVSNSLVPDGDYHIDFRAGKEKRTAYINKSGDNWIVKAGSPMLSKPGKVRYPQADKLRDSASIKDETLQKNFVCSTPSMAAVLVLGHSANGWDTIKNSSGDFISVYRGSDDKNE